MLPEEITDLVPTKYSFNSCDRCGKEIKKKLLLFNSKKECFICSKNICTDCTSREERVESLTGRKGYCCLDCYPKTKASSSSSLLPGVADINGAVDSLESKIPEQLHTISNNIEKVDNVTEGIYKVIDEIENVTLSINKIIETINRQVSEVKEFSQSFTLKNWSIIKKDIYYILLFSGIGIIVLVFIITCMIMFLIKYIYPLL